MLRVRLCKTHTACILGLTSNMGASSFFPSTKFKEVTPEYGFLSLLLSENSLVSLCLGVGVGVVYDKKGS